jgi:hypothetical protein
MKAICLAVLACALGAPFAAHAEDDGKRQTAARTELYAIPSL